MKEPSFELRFESALHAGSTSALSELARALKAEGFSQSEVYDLYLHQLRKHLTAAEEPNYLRIAAVMDAVAGHCERNRWLFESRM